MAPKRFPETGEVSGAVLKRFRDGMDTVDGPREGEPLLVALSGGLDSVVLLHLLRFAPGGGRPSLCAAHFDHGMREGSGADARWVRGLCRAWGVPLTLGAAETVPATEEEAREMRYRFLFRVREEVGARWLLTAHHADDQVETVLFRVLRGTGLRGLGGIPFRREPGVLRPLLSISRKELEAYALASGIRFREDPSNTDLSFARNYLREVGIPGLEKEVAPGTRESLLRLARLARENEEAWGSLLPGMLDGMTEEGERGVFIVRSAFLAYHPALRARLLREVLGRFGVHLDEAGTRSILEFTRTGAGGRSLSLPGGFRLFREFDRFLLAESGEVCEEKTLGVPTPEAGSGEAVLGGERYRVVWGGDEAPGAAWTASLLREGLEFPLLVRGWSPGDRISLPYGTKKLKKLFGEAGIAVGERNRIPLLVDASGNVLWVAGLVISSRVRSEGAETPFIVGIGNVHHS